MSSGFRTKTRTGVNCFLHADPAVRARTHPARASVQRSLQSASLTNRWSMRQIGQQLQTQSGSTAIGVDKIKEEVYDFNKSQTFFHKTFQYPFMGHKFTSTDTRMT